MAGVGVTTSVPRLEHVDAPIDSNRVGTQLSICKKICFCKGQSRFRKRNRVIRCRWDVSLPSERMFLYPVGFPSTFTWMEARKALKEKRQISRINTEMPGNYFNGQLQMDLSKLILADLFQVVLIKNYIYLAFFFLLCQKDVF